jgi:GH25 family lysozyme M1 (1,4-beta-N-acetylmuramidase)
MTTPAAPARAQLLDVSNYQGHFDWTSAKASVPHLAGGIFRLTQGLGGPGMNSPDPDAEWNHRQIAELGLHRGMYHFLDPRRSGAEQAKYFVIMATRLGLTPADMLWLDNETAGTSPAAVAACARDFMAELDKQCPRNPRGVYTFINFARDGNCEGLGDRPLWLAYPAATAPVPPPPWMRWTFWQWGTRQGTDADSFNGTPDDLDTWIKSFSSARTPVMHTADGKTSLHQMAAAIPGMTVHETWWETARHRPHGWGPLERAYLQAGDWDAPMRAGMEMWG